VVATCALAEEIAPAARINMDFLKKESNEP
jgi:hypothetical protein